MGATSVTGTGPGESNGKYKPENNASGCSCGGKPPEETPRVSPKSHCVTKLKVGNRSVYRTGGSGGSIKVCGN